MRHTPQLSVKTWGGGVWGWGGGSAGGCGGGGGFGRGGGGFPRWGGLRATHYYHMHTLHWSRGRAPNAGSSFHSQRHLYSTSSCYSGAQNMHGLMKGQHAQKKIPRRWRHGPKTTISQNPGGGGGGHIQGLGLAVPPCFPLPWHQLAPYHSKGTETWPIHPRACVMPRGGRGCKHRIFISSLYQ